MKLLTMGSALAALLAPALAHGADFMGVELGAKFDMPECQIDPGSYGRLYTYVFEQPVRPCWQHNILRGKPGDSLDTDGSFKVDFVSEDAKRPAGVIAASTSLVVVNGLIEGVEAGTGGYEKQDRILQLLKNKFGKPTSLESEEMQNGMGAIFSSIEAEWKTADLEVEFSGIGHEIDHGYITVLTKKGAVFVQEEYDREEREAPSF